MSAHLGEDYRPLIETKKLCGVDYDDGVECSVTAYPLPEGTIEVEEVKTIDHAAELAEALDIAMEWNWLDDDMPWDIADYCNEVLRKYQQSRGEG